MMSRKPKILVVDDELDLVRTLEKRLSSLGYDVYKASNGRQALAVAEKRRPDLILLDISMPEGDGHFVAAQLRRSPHLAKINIIYLSASAAFRDRRSALYAGATHYFVKPFDARELAAAIEDVLPRRRASAR